MPVFQDSIAEREKNEYNRYWIFISTDAITPEIPGIFTGGVWRREVYRLRKIGELEELCSLQEEEIRECEERLGELETRRKCLETEWRSFPREQNLKTAARELERWEEAEDIIKFIIRC